MSQQSFNLRQAAEHVHLEPNELKHIAQRGEIAAEERGGDWFFRHRDLDEWAQRELLAAAPREQLRRHRAILDENRRARRDDWRLAGLFRVGGVELALPGKAKAGVIRDMSDLAAGTGCVYDADGLYNELKAREDVASTAIGNGVAFLHPRYHDPYLFEESFIAYGRAARPVFYGAPDGEPTRHFFLICAVDDDEHLHILARLAVMSHSTELLTLLDEAETPDRVLEIIASAEEGVLR